MYGSPDRFSQKWSGEIVFCEQRELILQMIGFYNYTVIVTYMGFIFALLGIMTCQQDPGLAVNFLIMSGFCDMFDGAIARTRKRTEPEKRFGIQIDSLADLTSFGVMPACLGYAIGMQKPWQIAILAGYALAALIRLAYFNVMEEIRQEKEGGKRKYYDGLPVTPAAAIMTLTYYIATELFPGAVVPIYSTMMAITGVCFVAPIKIKKLSMKESLAFALVCLLILFAVFKISGRF